MTAQPRFTSRRPPSGTHARGGVQARRIRARRVLAPTLRPADAGMLCDGEYPGRSAVISRLAAAMGPACPYQG